MRSGFKPKSTWLWFDVGPYGSSIHAHRDKLSLTLHARGSMLLVDSGKFAYAGTDLSNTLHTQYARFTIAHNTLTFDGCDQKAEPPLATAPVPSSSVVFQPAMDSALGSMDLWDGLNGTAQHSRGLIYVRAPDGQSEGDFVCVVDHILSSKVRSFFSSVFFIFFICVI